MKLSSKQQVKKLQDQKVIYDPMKQVLVVFRAIITKPNKTKLLEVKNMKSNNELEEVRAVLRGVEVEVSIR